MFPNDKDLINDVITYGTEGKRKTVKSYCDSNVFMNTTEVVNKSHLICKLDNIGAANTTVATLNIIALENGIKLELFARCFKSLPTTFP